MDRILVIIVTYNAMQWAERCLSSIRESTIKADVLIVDNGSTDGSQEYIKKNFPEMELLQSKENLGFGRANNIGMRKALDEGYDYAYLLNQDAWIMPDTLQRLVDVQKKHPEYGILSPMQMQADGLLLDKNFSRNVCKWESTPELLSHLYLNKANDVYPVTNVMAAHWLVSRECIETVGAFSPTFSHYGEDNNYIDRTHYHGLKVGITPSSKAVHDRSDRKETLRSKEFFLYIKYLVRFSNPASQGDNILKFIAETFIIATKHHSANPLRNMFRLLSQYKSIKNNRTLSINSKKAFL